MTEFPPWLAGVIASTWGLALIIFIKTVSLTDDLSELKASCGR